MVLFAPLNPFRACADEALLLGNGATVVNEQEEDEEGEFEGEELELIPLALLVDETDETELFSLSTTLPPLLLLVAVGPVDVAIII